MSFWAERLRESKYNISDEELRPYFALPNVLDGLFKVGARWVWEVWWAVVRMGGGASTAVPGVRAWCAPVGCAATMATGAIGRPVRPAASNVLNFYD